MATNQNITVVQGMDSLFSLQALMDGAPLPFNDFPSLTPYIQVKSAANVSDAQSPGTLYTTSNGLVVTDAAAGQFSWALPNAATYDGGIWYRAYVVNPTPSPELIYIFLTGYIAFSPA